MIFIGDNLCVVVVIVSELGLEFCVGLLLVDKVNVVIVLNVDVLLVMVGDGINDVLVMKVVIIGIVMGSGIDVVLEMVDVVLIYNCLIGLV